VDPSSLAVDWPGEPAIIVSSWGAGQWRTLAAVGDLDAPRSWASVTKIATALAVATALEEGTVGLDDPVGPPGATLAHLLAHAAGLGFEEGDPTCAPATKRVYSNLGIDLAARHAAGALALTEWLAQRVLGPLAMTSTSLAGRASEGLVGSTRDLATLAREWIAPSLIPTARRDAMAQVYWPTLAGVVPGFGRFDPCPWGAGVEVRGGKNHWMGEWPASSFGHFGRSGALALVNVDEGLALVATSTVDFGPWARDLWPRWTSDVRTWALAS